MLYIMCQVKSYFSELQTLNIRHFVIQVQRLEQIQERYVTGMARAGTAAAEDGGRRTVDTVQGPVSWRPTTVK